MTILEKSAAYRSAVRAVLAAAMPVSAPEFLDLMTDKVVRCPAMTASVKRTWRTQYPDLVQAVETAQRAITAAVVSDADDGPVPSQASVRVIFFRVGRTKCTFQADIPIDDIDGLDQDAMADAIAQSGALASSDINVTLDQTGHSGAILAGLRPVGRWMVSVPDRIRLATLPAFAWRDDRDAAALGLEVDQVDQARGGFDGGDGIN